MELGIKGKSALVCGASKGLGFACASALAAEGVEVTIVARTATTIERAAEVIRGAGGAVQSVVADVATAKGRAAALAVCPSPDILINNAGGPPTGNFRDWTREDWLLAIDTNMLAPIELIKATVDGMIARRWGRIVNITSFGVKAPIDVLGLSNGARSGLTGFVGGLAREVARHGVTINNLLPGVFETERLAEVMVAWAAQEAKPVDVVHAARKAANPAGRFGRPEEFGAFCAFLCSAHTGYLAGQNLLLDGGAIPTLF